MPAGPDAGRSCGRAAARARGSRPVGLRSASEGAQAVGDVDEVAIVGGDELEPAGRLDRVAGAVVEVAEDVPLAEVVVADPLRPGVTSWPSCAAPPCRSP